MSYLTTRFAVLACTLLLGLSACSDPNAGSPGPVTPTPPAATEPATPTLVTPTLKSVPFAYTDNNTSEVNVAAGITAQSAFENATFSSNDGTLHLFADTTLPFPVFLKDPAGTVRAITEYVPTDTQVIFSALETARALVQETLLIKGSAPDTRVLIKNTLDSGKYDAPLSSLTAAIRGGQHAVDSDENLQLAYDVAFTLLNDISPNQIQSQTILTNVRDTPGFDPTAQANLDITEQKDTNGIDTKFFSLLDKGPVSYGVAITYKESVMETSEVTTTEVSHMTLVSASSFTGVPFADFVLGAEFNPGHVDLKADKYHPVVCKDLTVTYSATEKTFSYSSEDNPRPDLSPRMYNGAAIISTVADIANIPLPKFENNPVMKNKILKFSNAATTIIARITSNWDLSGSSENTQPLEKFTYAFGLIREVYVPFLDLLKETYDAKSFGLINLYQDTNTNLSQKLTKSYDEWIAKNEAKLKASNNIFWIVNAATSGTKLFTIGFEMGRELLGYPHRTAHILFNPCAPIIKVLPVAPANAQVGGTANGDIIIQNMQPNSTLTFAARASGSLNLQPTSGEIVNDDVSTNQTSLHFTEPCLTKGSTTETVVIHSSATATPDVNVPVTINCVEPQNVVVPPTVEISAPVGKTAEKTFSILNSGKGTLTYTITGEGFQQVTPRTGSVSADDKDGALITLLYACTAAETKTLTLLVSTDADNNTVKQPVNVNIQCSTSFSFPNSDAFLTIPYMALGGGGGYTDGTYTTRICDASAEASAVFTIDASLDSSETNFITPHERSNKQTLAPLKFEVSHTGADADKCLSERDKVVDQWVAARKAEALSIYTSRLIQGYAASDVVGVAIGDGNGGTIYSVTITPTR